MDKAKVGIWRQVRDEVIAIQEDPETVRPVDGWRDSAAGHFECWERLQCTRMDLAPFEYTEFPRGRVLLRDSDQCFVLYGGREFLNSPLMQRRIVAEFGLEHRKTRVTHDRHYDKATPLLPGF